MIEVVVDEQDFDRAVGKDNIDRDVRGATKTLGDADPDLKKRIVDMLPRVLAKRMKDAVPPDFILKEIELKVAVQGTPFGVGLVGEAIIKFCSKG